MTDFQTNDGDRGIPLAEAKPGKRRLPKQPKGPANFQEALSRSRLAQSWAGGLEFRDQDRDLLEGGYLRDQSLGDSVGLLHSSW